MKMEPKIGDKIYVPTSFYLSHGEDDFVGGLATIKNIEKSKSLPKDHFNYLFVTIEERKGSSYNYKCLMEDQDKLKKEFGDQKAYPDPDYSPEFNNDIDDWK